MSTSGMPRGRDTGEFYQRVLERLNSGGAEYLIGGAYGLEHYTGIARHTKDVDVFVRPRDRDRVLAILADAGYRTEVASPVWLAKAHSGDDFADVIFGSGNGVAIVDDAWFTHARPGRVLGVDVRICPPEETIWSKGFVLERERYDGADILHLVRACGRDLDWRRLLDRFGDHGAVLLSHLVLFRFVYPAERALVPDGVLRDLFERLDRDAPPGRPCRGTLLSRRQYRVDLDEWGYADGRLAPWGRLSPHDLETIDADLA